MSPLAVRQEVQRGSVSLTHPLPDACHLPCSRGGRGDTGRSLGWAGLQEWGSPGNGPCEFSPLPGLEPVSLSGSGLQLLGIVPVAWGRGSPSPSCGLLCLELGLF